MISSATDLLSKLARQGVTIAPSDHGTVRAWPTSRLSAEVQQAIPDCKPTLLALFSMEAGALVALLAGFLAKEGQRDAADRFISDWRAARLDLFERYGEDGIDTETLDGMALERLLLRFIPSGQAMRTAR